MTERFETDASGHVEDDLGTVDDGVVDAESSIEKRLAPEGRSLSDADSCMIEIEPRPAPFARSSIQQTVEKPSKKRPRKGSPDVYPTTILHDQRQISAASVGKRSINCDSGYYTKLLHNLPRGVCVQGSIYHLRRRVPQVLKTVIGRSELWRSLRTDSPQIAARRFHFAAAEIESEFESARIALGMALDAGVMRVPHRSNADSAMDTLAVRIRAMLPGAQWLSVFRFWWREATGESRSFAMKLDKNRVEWNDKICASCE